MVGAVDNAGQVIAGVAIAVVGLSVALFSLVGFARGDDDVTVAPAPSPEAAAPATTPTDDPSTAAPTPAPADEPSTSAPTPEPTEEPSPTTGEDSEEATAEPSPTASPTPAEPTVDPSTVSVQVLDADGVPGDASSDRASAAIAAAGYRVAARNAASITYDVTTVLYTAGNETAARELAAALGYREVREKPDNLSPSVELHVVVGRDLVE